MQALHSAKESLTTASAIAGAQAFLYTVQYRLESALPRAGATMATNGFEPSCRYILGIESSCDDTAVAVLRTDDGAILGHSIAGQVITTSAY